MRDTAGLTSLGWRPEFADSFAPYVRQGFRPGRIAQEDKHAYLVLTETGELLAQVPGRLLHRVASAAELPKVGDWVAVRPLPERGKAVIEAILPRRTQVVRKLVGRRQAEQVLATNLDTAFIVLALDASFNVPRLERFLVVVRDGGAQAVVVLNKVDLADDPEARRGEACRVAGETPVFLVSARTGRGLGQLRSAIQPGQTVAFIGTSGVGKSSLINRLYGEDIQATLEVREGDAKGRHATTWRELIVLPGGGLVIDTPGMRELHVWMADEGLAESFADVEELAVQCHFRNCSHTVEKRCAVLEAVADGRLTLERLENYRKLRHELDYLAAERRRHTFSSRSSSGSTSR